MANQIPDRKTIGIPADFVLARHEIEQFRDSAEEQAQASQQSADDSAESAAQSLVYASAAHESANEAKGWSMLQAQAVEFGPDEPSAIRRFDGMTWLKTNETAHEIVKVRRWDHSKAGVAVIPGATVLPAEDLFPDDTGEWTDFTFNLN